jgi:N-acetylmuramoyl-L-alanine amidase
MKSIFKGFTIMILTFLLCVSMQVIVKASTCTNVDSKKDVVISKSWTVSFNKPLSSTTVNTTNIKVVGENDKYIDIKVSLANNNKSVIVKSVKSYEYNKIYTLIVTENVKSVDGKPLPKEVRMKFNTESAPTKPSQFIVCINAARGGSDSGNIGPTGLKEKDVNLEVALRLGKLLEKENVQVVYTRTGDSVTWNSGNEIQERIKIANNAKSDLLLTISCNSHTSEATNGIETNYLIGSDKGKELAEYIQAQLVIKTAAIDRGTKECDYNSLKWSNAPGAQALLGFISNKGEESKLRTSEYKDKLALAFTEAVKKYISANSKYGSGNGDTSSGNIYMNDITENIRKGDKYILPLKIKATTDNSGEKEVNVVWDIKSLDTNIVGVYVFQGTIKESTKKANLVVNVIEVTKTNYKVVINPGHGAADSGAVGPMGTKEKDINLQISFKIGNILVKNGVETVYTRTSDNITYYTSQTKNLQAICDVSNNAKPDYFVSIHANSFTTPTVSGIETFYFEGSVAGEKLAQAVQNELIKETGRVNRGLKPTTTGLYVLNNVDATAILVETSFLSNPEEEKLLVTDAYQDKLAKAISTGILKRLGIINIVY